MKRSCIALLAILLLTGCSSNIKQEVEVFNRNTEVTITRYEEVTSAREDKTEELIQDIANGKELDITLSDTAKKAVDEAHKTLNDSSYLIEATPVIKTDNFYTRLGYNFVTQAVQFGFSGKVYLLEILWTSGTSIDSFYLEVLRS